MESNRFGDLDNAIDIILNLAHFNRAAQRGFAPGSRSPSAGLVGTGKPSEPEQSPKAIASPHLIADASLGSGITRRP
jgi:hypothetical protein